MRCTKNLFLFLLIILQLSCGKNGNYYDFSEETKDFFRYNEKDTFMMKCYPYEDTINFTIESKTFSYEPGDCYPCIVQNYMQTCLMKFKGGDYSGELKFVRDLDNNLWSEALIYKDFINRISFDLYIIMDEIKPDSTFIFDNSSGDSLMYSISKGIMYFNDHENGVSYELIEDK